MKKLRLLFIGIMLCSFCYSQTIFKGFEYEMSRSEAKKEFKKNKEAYTSIDIGNGFLYRTYTKNFVYGNEKLVGILLTPKGSAFGQSYDLAANYLTHTRGFFESLGYETFIDNEWWNAPVNYVASGSKWGLVLNKKDKSTIVQMYPISYNLSGRTVYLVKLMVWNYDWWMNSYNEETKKQSHIANESGF